MLAPNNVDGYSIASAGDGDLHAFDDLTRDEQHPMFQVNLAYQWTYDFQPIDFIAKLPPSTRHRARTSHASTASLRRTRNCARS